MSLLPEYAIPHIFEIAKNNGFTDFTFETKIGTNHGDNFSGLLISVIISGKREIDGELIDDRLDLLCKTAPSSLNRRKEFNTDLMFSRESFAYNRLLPTLVEFQKERGKNETFISFPKCYFATCNPENNEYLVIMDDLRTKGFKLWPRNKALTIDHCRLVIQELAKFHAVSFALKDQKPEIFDEFKALNDILRKFFKSDSLDKHIDVGFNRAINVLNNDEHKAVLQDIKVQFLTYLEDLLHEDKHKSIGVINHGDCWNNNIIYKYQNDNEEMPQKMCIVDWQVIRYGSPVIDFLQTIFTSTDKQLRDQEYENLKRLYHSTLSDHIEKLGSDAKNLFSYAEFERQLKQFGSFALVISPMIIQISLAKSEDIPDLNEVSEKLARGEEADDIVRGYDEDTQKVYADRINGLVTDIVNFGYYTKL